MNKSILFLASFLMLGFRTEAAPACKACETVAKLTNEVKTLSYAKPDDHFKGGEKALLAVVEIEKFGKLAKKDPNRLKLFKDILALSREVSPYDGEGQVADLLSVEIKNDAKLGSAFHEFLKSLAKAKAPDSCKTKQLESGVNEKICLMKAGIDGQDVKGAQKEAKLQECTSKFNFVNCFSGK